MRIKRAEQLRWAVGIVLVLSLGIFDHFEQDRTRKAIARVQVIAVEAKMAAESAESSADDAKTVAEEAKSAAEDAQSAAESISSR